jgi:hypothetical protein
MGTGLGKSPEQPGHLIFILLINPADYHAKLTRARLLLLLISPASGLKNAD